MSRYIGKLFVGGDMVYQGAYDQLDHAESVLIYGMRRCSRAVVAQVVEFETGNVIGQYFKRGGV